MFHFKHFSVSQKKSPLKVGTDAMVLGAVVNALSPKNILDIGAGTGVLSLMCAQNFSKANIDAIEIDEASCVDCQLNFSASPWKNRLTLINADVLQHSFDNKYDLIISNPPFYQNSLMNDDLRLAQAKHESFLPIDQLFYKVKSILNDSGSFWMIFPENHAENVFENAQKNGLYTKIDYLVNGKPNLTVRRIVCFVLNACNTEKKSICIRNEDGSYTDEYKSLTKEFHGKVL